MNGLTGVDGRCRRLSVSAYDPLLSGWLAPCLLSLALTTFLALSSPTLLAFGPVLAPSSPLNRSLQLPLAQFPDRVDAQLAIAPGDWPQLQRDPQRTGYSPQEVRPPYRYYWRWNEAPFASRTQPVVADGRLFIGSLNGRMYALDADQDAQGGPPTVLWAQDVGAPIRHTAVVYEGRVYFGAQDGRVYALDAVSGASVWTFLTGGGITAAPVAGNGTIYIGSSDGNFYALDAASGELLWTYYARAPILTSASLSPDGQVVYFGAEDIHAYALRTADGSLLWRTPLQGQSLAERWPVVVEDTVIYRSQPLRNFHFLLHEGDDVMNTAGPVNPNWAADWAAVRLRIVSFLTAHPDRQTFFALDAASGALRGPAPVLYTYGNGDAPDPPVVKDGAVFLRYRARHGIQTDGGSSHVTTLYDAELGRMDLATLDITGLTASQPFRYQFRATSDEPSMLSIGGDLLYVDNWERLGALDLQTGALIEVANVANDWQACPPPSTPPSPPDPGGQCPAHEGPMPFFEVPWPFPGPQVGEGVIHRPLVIAAGRLFWRVVDGGLASIGPAFGSAVSTELPLESPVPAPPEIDQQVTPISSSVPESPVAQSFNTYVWTEPTRPVADPPADLVERLTDEVQRIVNTNDHLLPFLLERGFTTNETFPGDSLYPEQGMVSCSPGNTYWFDSGELVYTLSIAYPYLPTALQARVRAYLAAEMNRYPPLQWLWGNSVTQGVRRESYPVTFQPNCWPPWDPPIMTLYALWAYARYTGDWAYVQNRWADIDALFDKKKGSIDNYAAISGAIGYARIAQHLGYSAAAAEGEAVAVQGMTNGLDFNRFLSTANARYPDPRNRYTGLRAPVFFGLTPEVGRYISDTNRLSATAYLNDLTDGDGVFLWPLTRLGLQAEVGESSFHGPDVAWSIFLAKAYIEGADRPTLRGYLDRPWGLGDLYHVQKLVATIEASGPSDPTPPEISNVAVVTVTFHSATIRWQTDEPASSQVEYGLTTDYPSRNLVQVGTVTEHYVTVMGLRPSTLYHFRVCSTSPGGRNCSADYTFVTAEGFEVFLPTLLRQSLP